MHIPGSIHHPGPLSTFTNPGRPSLAPHSRTRTINTLPCDSPVGWGCRRVTWVQPQVTSGLPRRPLTTRHLPNAHRSLWHRQDMAQCSVIVPRYLYLGPRSSLVAIASSVNDRHSCCLARVVLCLGTLRHRSNWGHVGYHTFSSAIARRIHRSVAQLTLQPP